MTPVSRYVRDRLSSRLHRITRREWSIVLPMPLARFIGCLYVILNVAHLINGRGAHSAVEFVAFRAPLLVIVSPYRSRLFPSVSNDFHIASESYGGHYMPQLAEEIAKRNEQAAADGILVINFKGFLVGNPYTDAVSNTVSLARASCMLRRWVPCDPAWVRNGGGHVTFRFSTLIFGSVRPSCCDCVLLC